jgi:hypothetical protein
MLELMETRENEISDITGKLIKAALAELDDVSFNNNVSVSVNNNPVEYNEITVSITGEDAIGAFTAALSMIRDDDDSLALVTDAMNIFNSSQMTVSNTRDMINELIFDLSNTQADIGEPVDISIYFGLRGTEIKGVDLRASNIRFRAFIDFNHGYEISLSEGISTVFVVSGGLRGNSEDFSGDIWFSLNGGISARVMEFAIKHRFGEPDINIAVKVFPYELINGFDRSMLNDMPNSMANILRGIEIDLTFANNRQGMTASLELSNGNEDISIESALRVSDRANVSLSIPNPNNVVDFNNINQVLENDIFTILGNATRLLGAIDGLGYDISFVYDMLIGMMFSF